MEAFMILTSAAIIDHIILYYCLQQDLAKWLDMTCNIAPEVQKYHLK